VRITLNGVEREIEPGTSVAGLVALLGMRSDAVAVERNLELVPRSRQAEVCLAEGDRVEVVTLVGGG